MVKGVVDSEVVVKMNHSASDSGKSDSHGSVNVSYPYAWESDGKERVMQSFVTSALAL